MIRLLTLISRSLGLRTKILARVKKHLNCLSLISGELKLRNRSKKILLRLMSKESRLRNSRLKMGWSTRRRRAQGLSQPQVSSLKLHHHTPVSSIEWAFLYHGQLVWQWTTKSWKKTLEWSYNLKRSSRSKLRKEGKSSRRADLTITSQRGLMKWINKNLKSGLGKVITKLKSRRGSKGLPGDKRSQMKRTWSMTMSQGLPGSTSFWMCLKENLRGLPGLGSPAGEYPAKDIRTISIQAKMGKILTVT